jgi:predicted DCC family thiol-disulfide oxidoreductase YuxK
MAKIDVIYNNSCPICSREVAGYRRLAVTKGAAISFVGIGDARTLIAGMTEDEAARRFHVVKDGAIVSGIDAFRLLWSKLPGWRWLARLIGLPDIYQIATCGYDWVAAPALYALHRRRQSCA